MTSVIQLIFNRSYEGETTKRARKIIYKVAVNSNKLQRDFDLKSLIGADARN